MTKDGSSRFRDEAHLQALLVAAIRADKLSALVEDSLHIANDESTQQFPEFSVDHLSRRACLRAAQRVLGSLKYLDILTADENISATPGEIMRPDIVCINAEQQSLVVFELKVSGAAARQAISELAAYEQELKNALPFLSEYDVCHIVVSPVWTTLLDHSVAASVTWSNRQVLCLEATLHSDNLHLTARVPEAWRITGAAHFPDLALPCVTLCLYRKDAFTPTAAQGYNGGERPLPDDDLDERIWTALTIIAREGDRIGSHGFALLWRDTSQQSLTDYNITICGISPFEFYKHSRGHGTIDPSNGRLTAALDEHIRNHDPDGLTRGLLHVATCANNLLNEISDPQLEGWNNWAAERTTLSTRAIPMLCEFWGALGDYSREYILNPAIRVHRRNLLRNGRGDWRDPRVGLPLIQSFIKPDIFYEGEVRCSDAFKLGVMLGLDRVLRANIRREDSLSIRAQYDWNCIEMLPALDELRMLANAATNVEHPGVDFRFVEDPLIDDEEESCSFVEWLVRKFLQSYIPAVECFYVGFFGAWAFNTVRSTSDPEDIPEEAFTQMREPLVKSFAMTIARALEAQKEDAFSADEARDFDRLRSSLGIGDAADNSQIMRCSTRSLFCEWPSILSLSDRVFDRVFHKHAPVADVVLDWVWLKQGVREARGRGEPAFGVILLANGQVVTGRTTPLEMGDFEPMKGQSEDCVLFLDRSNGMGLLTVVSWEDLESGKAFRRVSHGAGPEFQ